MNPVSKARLPARCAAVLLVLGAAAVGRAAGPAAGDGAGLLTTLRAPHPRLILTEERMAEIRREAANDPLLAKAIQDVINRADWLCKQPPLTYEKKGIRLLQVSRDCLERVYTCGLAWRLTARPAYADKVRQDLLTVSAFDDWNPEHFLDTAEMSHAVGIGYDWLYGYLSAADRAAIKAGLLRNGLGAGLAAYRGEKTYSGSVGGHAVQVNLWWPQSEYNWNQVCNGGLIIGALAVAESDPQYAATILPAALKSLPLALASYEPDGAWGEGLGYWVYATEYTVYTLAALQSALGTDFGLADRHGLAQAGWYPLYSSGAQRVTFNYADHHEIGRRWRIPSLYWLARRYGQPAFAAAESEVLRLKDQEAAQAGATDVIWYWSPTNAPQPLALDKYFGGHVEVAFLHGSWDDPRAIYVGCKAGDNQVNHGHLDLGNFVMDALNVRWARELGNENYDLPNFWDMHRGGKRWDYYRQGSRSHNVILLDNANQDPLAKAKMIRFRGDTNGVGGASAKPPGPPPGPGNPSIAAGPYVVVDLTEAYRPAATNAVRGIALVDGRRAVLVQDELALAKPCEVAWGMTTDARITVDGALATLAVDSKRLHARILAPTGAVFTVESAEQAPPLAANKGVSRLTARLPQQTGAVTVAVLLSPVWTNGQETVTAGVTPLSGW